MILSVGRGDVNCKIYLSNSTILETNSGLICYSISLIESELPMLLFVDLRCEGITSCHYVTWIKQS